MSGTPRSLMPRSACFRENRVSLVVERSGLRIGAALGAAGQVDADVEFEVLGEQVLEFAALNEHRR
jgi:hypothetical protein